MVLTGLFLTLVTPYKETKSNTEVILWLMEDVQALTGEFKEPNNNNSRQRDTTSFVAFRTALSGNKADKDN